MWVAACPVEGFNNGRTSPKPSIEDIVEIILVCNQADSLERYPPFDLVGVFDAALEVNWEASCRLGSWPAKCSCCRFVSIEGQ